LVTKTLICLANSFRPGGSCVAGIELVNGQLGPWVRPISRDASRAISVQQETYADGSRLAVLDIVEIAFDGHQPEHHQSENWLISQDVPWKKVGQATRKQLLQAVLPAISPLWHPSESTYSGHNDKIQAGIAMLFDSSLALVQPDTAILEVSYNPFGKKNEVWVGFTWAATPHKIKLTDGVQFDRFNTNVGDSHSLNDPLLCISLAEIWAAQGIASKLVAGLIL
jgi:hypothetical protein